MDKVKQTAEQAPLIRVDNVHKSFLMGKEAVQALRGITLDVLRGEMVCLMGPSGSGKTTLLNIIGGLEEPSRGHVLVDGENVVALPEDALSEMRLTKMGFVFQSYNLLANFTARENVEVPMALAGLNRRERRRRVEQLLESVGLADRARHYPSDRPRPGQRSPHPHR
jgi:putative ABC transport system ATP-binding protein